MNLLIRNLGKLPKSGGRIEALEVFPFPTILEFPFTSMKRVISIVNRHLLRNTSMVVVSHYNTLTFSYFKFTVACSSDTRKSNNYYTFIKFDHKCHVALI